MQSINYLPSHLQEMKEFKIITRENDIRSLELNVSIEDLYNDQFITETEKAISRYEKMLGITYKATDSLEDRRFKILAIYNKQLPYTKAVLEQNLKIFCGADGYKLFIDYKNSTVVVGITLTARSMYDSVQKYLEAVIPMNLVIDLMLLYNQHKIFSDFIHKELGKYTHEQLREEVVEWRQKLQI